MRSIQWRGLKFNSSELCSITNIATLVTNACNSDCYHCFRSTERKNNKLNLDSIIRLSEYVKKSGVELFHVTGGEPFLIKRIDKIFIAYSKIGIHTSAVSNGYFLTHARLDALYNAGLNSICLSAHSFDKTIHERLTRTVGGFDRLESAIIAAKTVGLFVRINLPVSKFNISNIEKTIQWLLDLRVDRIKVLRISPFGKASVSTNFEHISDFEWLQLSNYLDNLFSGETISIKIQRLPENISNNKHGYCTVIPFRHFNIDNYGDIYPCCLLNGIEKYSIGNLKRVFEIGWMDATLEFTNRILDMANIYDSAILPCMLDSTFTQSLNICPLHSSEILKNIT